MVSLYICETIFSDMPNSFAHTLTCAKSYGDNLGNLPAVAQLGLPLIGKARKESSGEGGYKFHLSCQLDLACCQLTGACDNQRILK